MKMKLVKVLGVTLAVSCMLPMTAFAADTAEEVEVVEAEMALEDIATPEEAEAELEIIEDGDFVAEYVMVDDMMEGLSEETLPEYVTNYIIPGIVNASEEQSELFKEDDANSEMLITVWETNKADLGELIEIGEAEVLEKDEIYTVSVPVDFDIYDAEFVYTFTKESLMQPFAMPDSFVINVDYPFSVLMKQAGMNTIMGIGTVFVMLVFLSAVIALMGMVCKSINEAGNKKNAAAAPKAAPAPAPVVVEEETDDEEIIAVIAAAIAAAEGTSPDGFVVRSVRKVNRRKW